MKNKFLIEQKEVERILILHKNEKLLQEQDNITSNQLSSKNRQEAVEFFNQAKTFGCLTDKNLDFIKIYKSKVKPNSVYIKGISQNTGNTKRVFDDFSWTIVDSTGTQIKSGVWSCPGMEKQQQDTDVEVQNTQKTKDEYKQKYGAQEYSEIMYKTKADDPSFYKKVPFRGVEKNTLYIPTYKKNFVPADKSQYSSDSEQYKYLDALEKQGYILNPSLVDKSGLKEIKFNSQDTQGIFPNGLTVYLNPSGEDVVTDDKKCKEIISNYFKDFSSKNRGNDVDFNKKKFAAQACKNDNANGKWKLGLFGGANKVKQMLDVLSRKQEQFDNIRMPERNSEWLLN